MNNWTFLKKYTLEPNKIVEYVVFVIGLDKQLISEEIRLNRIQNTDKITRIK